MSCLESPQRCFLMKGKEKQCTTLWRLRKHGRSYFFLDSKNNDMSIYNPSDQEKKHCQQEKKNLLRYSNRSKRDRKLGKRTGFGMR